VLGGRAVLDGVDLSLEPGSFTLLAGCNGAGKTTLLTILASVARADAGTVELGNLTLASLPHRQRARSVALIPQESDCPFEFTGKELVTMGRHPHMGRFRGPTEADYAAVERALAQVDASDFADRSVHTLSGGELRRISIARALATEAQVLLADEPTSNLDLEHALGILDLFADLVREGRTVLLASHDVNLIAPRVHRVAILYEGRIHRQGTPEEALDEETVKEVFRVRALAPRGYFPRHFEKCDPGSSSTASR
jgi:iron complex transport system ATP-binding protein